MDLFWTEAAEDDRLEIFEHYTKINPRFAIDFDDLFSKETQRLITYPLFGREGKRGTREVVIKSSYIIIYSIEKNQINILRILHTSTNRL